MPLHLVRAELLVLRFRQIISQLQLLSLRIRDQIWSSVFQINDGDDDDAMSINTYASILNMILFRRNARSIPFRPVGLNLALDENKRKRGVFSLHFFVMDGTRAIEENDDVLTKRSGEARSAFVFVTLVVAKHNLSSYRVTNRFEPHTYKWTRTFFHAGDTKRLENNLTEQ